MTSGSDSSRLWRENATSLAFRLDLMQLRHGQPRPALPDFLSVTSSGRIREAMEIMAGTRSSNSNPVLKNFVPYKPKKGEEYMNEKQREHFKQILLDWREQLMQEVDRTVHHMQDDAANYPDPADRATQEEEFSLELRTRDRERKLIKKIDNTIEAIVQDDYGFCETCGIEIGIRRLEARPTADKCVDCKTLDEIKEKQLGS